MTNAESDIARVLLYIAACNGVGLDLGSGMVETPARFIRMLTELTTGYGKTGEEVLSRTFVDDDIRQYDGMVIVGDIPFSSICEHHLAPFMGVAQIGYVPD